jgi:hypothetical protein
MELHEWIMAGAQLTDTFAERSIRAMAA